MRVSSAAIGLCAILGVAGTASAGDPLPVDTKDLWDSAEDARRQQSDREAVDRQTSEAFGAGAKSAVEGAWGWYDHFKKGRDALDAWDDLDGADGEMVPEYSPDGAPKVPSRCAASEECRKCYSKSHEKLEKTRRLLEKLRIIMARTKNFADAAIAFGDSTSGVHAVSGMAWQNERTKILKALQGTKDAYDKKYAELMASLKDALMGVAECEEKHFDTPDWFDRFGFIYYQFMEDRYRRSE